MRVSGVTVRRRIFVSLIVGLIFFSVLIFRLGYIQIFKGQWLSENAEDLWSRNIYFEARRGKIYDRNGVLLAYNVSVPSIWGVPAQIKDPVGTAKKLAPILKQDEKKIYKEISKKQLLVRVPGGRKIEQAVASQVQQLNLPGIRLADDNKRYYPKGAFLSHVLGFTGIDNQGLTGIEKIYDKKLNGERGYISFNSNAKGEIIPGTTEQFVPPKDGADLHLTIDSNIQTIIERELNQVAAQYQPDDALVIAVSPKTGEVLGMASRPHYNPETYKDYPSSVYNRNLPIWKTYEPGSTFKIITLAAALQEGKVDLLNDTFDCPGEINVAGTTIHCWKRGGHGHQTFLEGVENSCNPGFVLMGQRLGKEKLFEYIKKFGFGQKTGIDLLGEENGLLFKLNRVGPIELATTSFGQGVSVTPIQQAMAVSAAVNGGTLMKPFVAKTTTDPVTGKVIEETKPQKVGQIISPETSAKVRHALQSVVANGTGRNAYVDGYQVGGKTGTAQVVENGVYSSNKYIVSFIGFAPGDNPEMVIYGAVSNPKALAFGGLIAAPMVKNIIESSVRYLNIPPKSTGMEKKYKYPDKKIVQVPDLVGLTRQELVNNYYTFSLDIRGTGNKVIYQSPQAGTRVEEGAGISILLGDK